MTTWKAWKSRARDQSLGRFRRRRIAHSRQHPPSIGLSLQPLQSHNSESSTIRYCRAIALELPRTSQQKNESVQLPAMIYPHLPTQRPRCRFLPLLNVMSWLYSHQSNIVSFSCAQGKTSMGPSCSSATETWQSLPCFLFP